MAENSELCLDLMTRDLDARHAIGMETHVPNRERTYFIASIFPPFTGGGFISSLFFSLFQD